MATPAPWSVEGTVAQAPPPVIGSIFCAIDGLPALDAIVWAGAELKSTSPGWSAAHVGAVNGPPDGAAAGQV